jgi:hypothetical protein
VNPVKKIGHPVELQDMALTLRRPCRCGHAREAHQHYRRGTDCSGCSCAQFHGQLVVTLRFGRQVAAVVLPDNLPYPSDPYVRPTHTVGLPADRPGVAPAARLPWPPADATTQTQVGERRA